MRRAALGLEALAALTLASGAIALLPFRRVAALAGGGAATRPATGEEARRIARAVRAVARRLPWRALCFQQGLAAQLMLRRRGLAAALHYGAGRGEDGALVAHVWLRSGGENVVGCEELERYGVLAVWASRAR